MDDNPARSITPAKYKEIINPLIVTADRFGREVEKFAEQLERLHPSKEKDPGTRYENALALADGYQDIAKATVERLRREHGPAHRSFLKEHWRARITGQAERAPGSLAIYDPEGSRGDPATVTTVADLTNWMQEQRTWVLFRQFIEFLCPRPGVNREQIQRDEPPAKDHIHQYSSEEKIWDRFLNEDELARERNIILTWLQQGGEESGDDLEIIGELLESGVDQGQGMWTQGWLHTKEAIKAQKRLRSWPQVLDPASPGLAASLLNGDKTESLVTQLDPDAVTRQRRVLDHQDQYSERSIWLACWHMLRRGKQWSEIREWCQDRAEGWRAVSLRGAIPAWDTAVDEHKSISDSTNGEGNSLEAGQETVAPRIEGNRSRALWRRVCFALARSGGLNEYERAVYGALSGDLETVEKVCLEWDDFLFAHYNSLVISQFDNYLQSRFPDRLPLALTRKFGLFDSVQYHGEPDTVGQRLVEQLKAHQVAGKEALTPMKIIQGSLIAKTFGELVYQHGITLAVLANRDNRSKLLPLLQEAGEGPQDPSRLRGDDFDVLRVLCHMVLICQELGLDMGYGDRRATVENVIVAYIDFLRLAGKISMVPLYASRLPVERQIPTLAIVLRDVTSPARRRELVRLMEGYGIDVCKVIKKQIGSFLKESGMKLNEIKDESITVQILEDTPPGQLRLPPIKDDFIGTELDAVDEGLISSFEWYLYVDGHWKETFVAGASLFKRFFRKFIYIPGSHGGVVEQWSSVLMKFFLFELDGKKLAAARRLAERMSSSHISQAKTPAILGEAVDITWDWEDEIQSQLAQTGLDDEDDGGRRRRSSSIDRQRMTRQILAAQAKLYTEFEKLAWALTELEGWSKVMHAKYVFSFFILKLGLRETDSWMIRFT